jgi:thioesterase domain-containing protein
MAGVLGAEGLNNLKQRVLDWRSESPERPAPEARRIYAYGATGPLYADEVEEGSRQRRIARALREIADAQGDVDSYIAQYDAAARRIPHNALEIAERLLEAGRAAEALTTIDAVELGRLRLDALDLQLLRLEALEALGRTAEAQSFRWACFTEALEGRHLRAYLKGLPDFDDVEAEDRAMALALAFPDVHAALSFLVAWPALDRANALVLARFAELDGDIYQLLSPAAAALEARYPLAATLVRRSMIDFTLNSARAKRYPHAARHLAECAADAGRIGDFGAYPSHEAYHARLMAEHGRKTGFWQTVP